MNPSLQPEPFSPLEKLLFAHLLGLLLGSSWFFGGNIWWMRDILAWWASGGLVLSLLALAQPGDRGRDARRKAWWLLPWLLVIVQITVSAFNPSFQSMLAEGERVLVHRGAARPAWPSTIDPKTTLQELWLYAGVYLSAFNLLLVPRSRRLLRGLFTVGAVNCLLLAIFGSMQKLLGAGFYFGAMESPNARYFGTFIYNNHWGAFMILWLAAAGGLLYYHGRRHRGRDLWHSPFTGAVVGLLFIAVSGPMSASRAATAMAAGIVAILIWQGMLTIIAVRREARRSVVLPLVTLLAVATAAVGGIGWLTQRAMGERYTETRAALMDEQSIFAGRMELYRDTWELAMRKPVFGWGFESYGAAFQLIRPRPLAAHRQYESSYTEAHSDWLQCVAELGLVGTGLVVLMGLIPLLSLIRAKPAGSLPRYCLLGCLVVSAYAWVEFPFANAAVLIAFWLLLFGTVRYVQLQPVSSAREVS
jgi:O-antigen ligase